MCVYYRERPALNAFDMGSLRMQVPVGRPLSNTRPLNKQIMKDFNQLKYRGKIQVRCVHGHTLNVNETPKFVVLNNTNDQKYP